MTLDEFIYSRRITLREFADLIDFSASYVSQVKNGHKKPSARMIYIVMQVTNGTVDLSMLRNKNG